MYSAKRGWRARVHERLGASTDPMQRRMTQRGGRLATTAVMCGLAAIGVAACGSSSKSSGTSKTGSGSSASTAKYVSEANALVAPYIGHPSAFPVTQKLNKRPTGDTLIYVSAGTPVSQQGYEELIPAAKLMGLKLSEVSAGTSAQSVATAFATVESDHPSAIDVNAIDLDLWASQVKKLQKEGIQIVSNGVFGLQKYGVPSPAFGNAWFSHVGQLDAAYIAAHFGQKSNIVFYVVPGLQLTQVELAAFKPELAKLCPGCTMRTVDIDIATLGNTASQTVANDLQAHPSTTVAVFSADEIALGLHAALKAAGITAGTSGIKTIGNLPIASNLAALHDGYETVQVAFDLAVFQFEQIDQAAREITGQKQTGEEAQGFTDLAILTPSDIKAGQSSWTGYPNYTARFKKLWGLG